MNRSSEPGYRCASMHDPAGRRGIWYRQIDGGIEICARREGDDVHVILREGDALTREQLRELQGALSTGAWMVETAVALDLAKHNQALRECLAYARSKRSKDFDFDTWDAMCKSAMAGAQAPSALENEIALHAQTRDALIAVRKERDALLGSCAQLSSKEENRLSQQRKRSIHGLCPCLRHRAAYMDVR